MVYLSAYYFIQYTAFAITIFFLPLYLMDRGLDVSQVGLTFAVGSIVSIFAQPLWGFISDKKKTVKRIIQFTLVIAICISFAFYQASSFIWILLLWMIFSFFSAPLSPLTDSLALSYAKTHNKNYGSFRLWGSISLAVTSFAFGSVLEWMGIGKLGYLYIAVLFIILLSTFMIQDAPKSPVNISLQSVGQLLTNRRFLWFMFLALLIYIPHRMNDNLMGIYMSGLGASKEDVGHAWSVATLSGVPALALVGYILRKRDELLIMSLAALMYVLRWLSYTLSDDLAIFTIVQVFNAVTLPIFMVASFQYLTKIVPDELRSTGQTLFSSMVGMATFIGSAGGGWVMNSYDPHLVYYAGSLLALTSCICFTLTYVQKLRLQKVTKGSVASM